MNMRMRVHVCVCVLGLFVCTPAFRAGSRCEGGMRERGRGLVLQMKGGKSTFFGAIYWPVHVCTREGAWLCHKPVTLTAGAWSGSRCKCKSSV